MAFLAGLARVAAGAARLGATESAATSGLGARAGSLFGSSEAKLAGDIADMAPRHNPLSNAQHNMTQEPLSRSSMPTPSYDVATNRGGQD